MIESGDRAERFRSSYGAPRVTDKDELFVYLGKISRYSHIRVCTPSVRFDGMYCDVVPETKMVDGHFKRAQFMEQLNFPSRLIVNLFQGSRLMKCYQQNDLLFQGAK